MEKKDLDFLIELREKLKSQDTDCQAAPRFWVVAHTVREYGVESGYEDGWIVIEDDMEWTTPEEFANYLLTTDILPESCVLTGKESFEDLIGLAPRNLFTLVGYRDNRSQIAPNTMFLTKEECKKHIAANDYHYMNPHTYAMTAWRSPEVERLLKILESADWESFQSKDE